MGIENLRAYCLITSFIFLGILHLGNVVRSSLFNLGKSIFLYVQKQQYFPRKSVRIMRFLPQEGLKCILR